MTGQPTAVERVEPVDALFRDDRALLLYDRELVELSPLGAEVFRATTGPTTVTALAEHLGAVFGPPPGDPVAATAAVVAELVDRGVLRPAPPARKEPP